MEKRCLRLSEGNMRKECCVKLLVVSSQKAVWCSISSHGWQGAFTSAGHRSQRKPPRMSSAHWAEGAHASDGHTS
jgi:hypothetical protein